MHSNWRLSKEIQSHVCERYPLGCSVFHVVVGGLHAAHTVEAVRGERTQVSVDKASTNSHQSLGAGVEGVQGTAASNTEMLHV